MSPVPNDLGLSDDPCDSCGRRARECVDISFGDGGEAFHVCVPCAADALRNGCTEQTCTHVAAVHQYDLP